MPQQLGGSIKVCPHDARFSAIPPGLWPMADDVKDGLAGESWLVNHGWFMVG